MDFYGTYYKVSVDNKVQAKVNSATQFFAIMNIWFHLHECNAMLVPLTAIEDHLWYDGGHFVNNIREDWK